MGFEHLLQRIFVQDLLANKHTIFKMPAPFRLRPQPVRRNVHAAQDLVPRQQLSRNPCPYSNGITIGSIQSFAVLCEVGFASHDLGPTPASNLSKCVDIYASYHPLCVGVAFEAPQSHWPKNYYAKSFLPSPTQQLYVIDTVWLPRPIRYRKRTAEHRGHIIIGNILTLIKKP